MDEYRFDGNANEFLGIMKWALIAREVQKENRKDRFDILTDQDKVDKFAEENGMDEYSLIKELMRLTDELKKTSFYEQKSFVEALLQLAEEMENEEANKENGV